DPPGGGADGRLPGVGAPDPGRRPREESSMMEDMADPTTMASATAATDALERRAHDLDAADPLRAFAERFVPVPDGAGVVAYLDGNSLGRPPRAAPDRLARFVREEWGGRLIRGWDEGWMELGQALGDRLGRVVLGAAAGQVVVADATTVLLYKLARAAVAARPDRR